MKTLPQSLDAERACLGAMLLEPAAVEAVMKLDMPPGVFMHHRHQQLYVAIRAMWQSFTPIDIVTLNRYLIAMGRLDSMGGIAKIAEIAEAVPSAVNAEWYAKILIDLYHTRDIIARCERILADAYQARPVEPLEIELADIEKQSGLMSQTVPRIGSQENRGSNFPDSRAAGEHSEPPGDANVTEVDHCINNKSMQRLKA